MEPGVLPPPGVHGPGTGSGPFAHVAQVVGGALVGHGDVRPVQALFSDRPRLLGEALLVDPDRPVRARDPHRLEGGGVHGG